MFLHSLHPPIHRSIPSLSQIKDSPSHVYRCTLDYRNSERELNVLARMQNDVLHVYIDRGDSHGFQFCLSVNVNVPAHLKVGKLHMAFRYLYPHESQSQYTRQPTNQWYTK